MLPEIVVESLPDLLRLTTPESPDPASGRLRDSGIYRGSSRACGRLLTSLDRLGTPEAEPHQKSKLEAHLLRNFMRYSRQHLDARTSNPWEALIIAEHHGLPTRLLDWSYSPLVAAHFATIGGEPGEDRIIWRLDWKKVHRHFGLPELALMVEDVDRVLGGKGIGSIWDLFSEGDPADAFVCMLEPPALNPRIVAQSATFTLGSSKTMSLDALLDRSGLVDAIERFLVPAAAARRIRDQLDMCGVDERRLFPDLDGLAAQLRRYYWVTG